MTENNKLWRTYWPATSPSNLDLPFYEDGDTLVSLEDGAVLEYPSVPERTVTDVAPAAFRCGAVLVDRWETKWGLSVAFSFPGSECAWFLLDDYQYGKFASIGVRNIEGVSFGFPVGFFWGDEDQAARFALAYGIKRDNQRVIESTLSRGDRFPYKSQKLKKLFGPLDTLEHEDVLSGLLYLQSAKGVNPMTVIAATKTIEVVNE